MSLEKTIKDALLKAHTKTGIRFLNWYDKTAEIIAEAVRSHVTDTEAANDALQEKCEELGKEFTALESRLAEKDERIESLQKLTTDGAKLIEATETDYKKLMADLVTRDTTIKKLEQKLKELRISTSHVAIALEEEQDKVEALTEALERQCICKYCKSWKSDREIPEHCTSEVKGVGFSDDWILENNPCPGFIAAALETPDDEN